MNLSFNVSSGNLSARQSFPEFQSATNTMQFDNSNSLPASVVVKPKKGTGLVIGGYMIGDAVSADLFGHPAIRY